MSMTKRSVNVDINVTRRKISCRQRELDNLLNAMNEERVETSIAVNNRNKNEESCESRNSNSARLIESNRQNVASFRDNEESNDERIESEFPNEEFNDANEEINDRIESECLNENNDANEESNDANDNDGCAVDVELGEATNSYPISIGSFNENNVSISPQQSSRTRSRAFGRNNRATYGATVDSNESKRCIDNIETFDVHARYDSTIVHLLDECLMRGPYAVFVQWLERYIRVKNYPGYICVVGYTSEDLFRTRFRGSVIADFCYSRIDPIDPYPIFSIKRDLQFPSVTILFTCESSRVQRTVATDGCIALLKRDTIKRSIQRVCRVMELLRAKYLNQMSDLYTFDENAMCSLPSSLSHLSSCAISATQRHGATGNNGVVLASDQIVPRDNDARNVNESKERCAVILPRVSNYSDNASNVNNDIDAQPSHLETVALSNRELLSRVQRADDLFVESESNVRFVNRDETFFATSKNNDAVL